MKFPSKLLVLLLAILLQACGVPTKQDTPFETVDWNKQQQRLQALQSWVVRGRIALQTADNGGQADFIWEQKNADDYGIRLHAPMGAGTTLIEGHKHGVSLTTPSGDTMVDTDVDRLILQINGWPIPVRGLKYWIRGLSSPGSPHQVASWYQNGLPEVMFQDGWRIEFRKHKQLGDLFVPGKLFISRVNNDEEVDVRLVVRQWEVGDV